MKTNNLVLVVGMLGVLFCGFFILTRKDITMSLIGFICGASLIMQWVLVRKSEKTKE